MSERVRGARDDGERDRVVADRERRGREPGEPDRPHLVDALRQTAQGRASRLVGLVDAELRQHERRQPRRRTATVEVRDHGAHDVVADPEAGALVAEQPAAPVGHALDLSAAHPDRGRTRAGDQRVSVQVTRSRTEHGEEVGLDHERCVDTCGRQGCGDAGVLGAGGRPDGPRTRPSRRRRRRPRTAAGRRPGAPAVRRHRGRARRPPAPRRWGSRSPRCPARGSAPWRPPPPLGSTSPRRRPRRERGPRRRA